VDRGNPPPKLQNALIHRPCELQVEFILPLDKFPTDYPYGMDLDNLLKRFLDALEGTIFRQSLGKDSIIVAVHARKRRVGPRDATGARFRTRPTRLD
jgi:Holliday junction resolvase RusA-like endonuclease